MGCGRHILTEHSFPPHCGPRGEQWIQNLVLDPFGLWTWMVFQTIMVTVNCSGSVAGDVGCRVLSLLPTQAAGLAGPSLFPAVVRRELPSLTASALSLWSSQSLARAALWDLAPGVQSPCKMAVQRALSRQSVFPQKRAWTPDIQLSVIFFHVLLKL